MFPGGVWWDACMLVCAKTIAFFLLISFLVFFFFENEIDLLQGRHTYPACTSCSDLTANVPMSSSASRETTTTVPDVVGTEHDVLNSAYHPDVGNLQIKTHNIKKLPSLSFKTVDELLNNPQVDANACQNVDGYAPPIHFPQARGSYPDPYGCSSLQGRTNYQCTGTYNNYQKRQAEMDVHLWYETNYLRKGLSTPMYYYCTSTLPCESGANKQIHPTSHQETSTCQECWAIQPNYYDATKQYYKSCVPAHGTELDIEWKRLTVRHSQAPWFTCFAQDQCRQECRAALGTLGTSRSSARLNMNQPQIKVFLEAWLNELIQEDSSSLPSHKWTGIGQTILSNVVKPNTKATYVDSSYFPRSTHYLYGLLEYTTVGATRMANNVAELLTGRRDVGTFRVVEHVNTTLLEAMSFLLTKDVTPLTANSLKECPDDQWCAPPEFFTAGFDIAKFCAMPEICPVRMHHATLTDVGGPFPFKKYPWAYPDVTTVLDNVSGSGDRMGSGHMLLTIWWVVVVLIVFLV